MKQQSKKKPSKIKQTRTRSSFDFTKLAEALRSNESNTAGEDARINACDSDNSTISNREEKAKKKNSAYDFSEFREELLATKGKTKIDEGKLEKDSVYDFSRFREAVPLLANGGDATIERLKALTTVAVTCENNKRTRRFFFGTRSPLVFRRSPVTSEMCPGRSARRLTTKDWKENLDLIRYCLHML